MRVTFQLRYHTHPGQSVWVTGNHEILGNDEVAWAIPLDYLNDQFWHVTLVLPRETAPDREIAYRYFVREPDGSIVEDWGKGRLFNPRAFNTDAGVIIDAWNSPGFYENAFYTEPFGAVLLKPRQGLLKVPSPERVTHIFRVKAPLLEKNETLCLLGNTTRLGQWDTNRGILLNRVSSAAWLTAELDLTNEPVPLEYKYGVYDFVANRFVRWEGGGNRILDNPAAAGQQTIVNDGFVVLPADTWRGAGVSIPVFSLRSQAGFGVGEFTDLKLLVDWCRAVGLKLIQILPVNDTSATHTLADSYPYAAISAFALHPLYLNLGRVASAANQPRLAAHEAERKRLNALPEVDYEAVMDLKNALLKDLYRLQRETTFAAPEYKLFFTANRPWLIPYAAFCYLRDRNGSTDFARWPSHRRCDPEEIAELAQEGSAAWDELALHFFAQFHLHQQLKEASDYAHSQGVILKGDIAIGVHRSGADTWQEPDLYRMEMQAGAPPDAFGIKGQNWSFPTYNWTRMKETGFAWWKRRFEQMGNYFDAFRIDHILGFFRIWSVPLEQVEGILGYFVPAIPVGASEFAARGVWFDHARYTRPFISDQVLAQLFGPAAEEVKARFLLPEEPGRYRLKTEFATQRRVERFFSNLEPSAPNKALQQGLFDLISNVILLEDATNPGERFHFRFAIETTSSFENLDPRTRSQLKELYIDYFFRRQDDFWMKEGLQKLPPLKRVTNMLVCGEDLGMVPPCVPATMKRLGLLSLEVQRMPKSLNREFSRPAEAPYLSVVTPSTHDMSTVRGWWNEDRQVTQRFYNQELSLPGAAPQDCEPWINRAVVRQHLDSPAMWSVFQLQDLLGMDPHLRRPNPDEERINVPANPKNHWNYRMHLWLEDLLQARLFNEAVRKEISESGRE